nr:DUF418 domain-containing protein [Metabacillus iocasae]
MNILLFLLGVLFVRSGVFMMDEQGRMKRRKLLIYGLLFGIPLNALTFVPGGFFDISVRYLFAPVLSLGYLGLLAWMLERAEHSFLLSRFEEVGKVALSCYILQNIASSILFYGWGFGLSEHYSGLNTFIIWLAICMLMFMFAHLWLRFFTLGPVEYVWRTLGNLPLKRLKHHHTHTPQ